MVRQSVPMRKKSREIQEETDVDALLRDAPVGRLGTSYEGEPYIVPLNYVYWQGKLYFHSALEGKKLRNLRANPLVCFELDDYYGVNPARKACDFGVSYASVIVYGQARPVESSALKRDALNALMAKYAPDGNYEPADDKDLSTVAVWEIEIEEKVGKRRPMK